MIELFLGSGKCKIKQPIQHNIEEYSLRVGQQACVVVACPGSKHQNNFRAFGAKPLEDVVKNLRSHIMTELEASLARQAPPEIKEDPSLHELPPLVVDGIPTPVRCYRWRIYNRITALLKDR